MNDRNKDGGGVIIAVKKVLKNVTVEVHRTTEVFESLWIVINNTKVKIRIGVVYLPQEKTLKDKDISNIYKMIKQQIQEGKRNEECVIITGDFNCKVGGAIEGNKETVSKGGKKLLKMLEKESMILLNSSKKCIGLWTREEKRNKSIIDYMIVDKESEEFVSKVTIDESRENAPFNLKKDGQEIKMIYSDLNPMILETNLVMKEIKKLEEVKKLVMTEDGYKGYKKEINDKKVSTIWDRDEDFQEKYTKWSEEILSIKRKYEQVRKPTTKCRSKTMRLLIKEKRKLKGDRMNEREKEKKEEIQLKIEELKKEMIKEEKEHKYRKLIKTGESIFKNGKIDSGGFWKLHM